MIINKDWTALQWAKAVVFGANTNDEVVAPTTTKAIKETAASENQPTSIFLLLQEEIIKLKKLEKIEAQKVAEAKVAASEVAIQRTKVTELYTEVSSQVKPLVSTDHVV